MRDQSPVGKRGLQLMASDHKLQQRKTSPQRPTKADILFLFKKKIADAGGLSAPNHPTI